ncbi:RHS repeat-associated core domain-containing protein [Microbacterium sp. SLBN-111]|uniref:RHS repeat-associated core domain-containing protein n=1 Tax=Microbacterium sp. SLBN-111 TaxID=3377733 RepID=UPI003C79357E
MQTIAEVTGDLAGVKEQPSVDQTATVSTTAPVAPQKQDLALASGADPVTVGDTGIKVVAAGEADSRELSVEVLDGPSRAALGNTDLALKITPRTGELGDVSFTIPDAVVDGGFGGDYAGRARWVQVPTDEAGKSTSKPTAVPEARSGDTQTLTMSASRTSVLMATSSTTSSSGTGSYAATPLKPSSTWDVSAQTGAFAWSYPIALPAAPAGDTPTIALQYNSQLVDGATASTNNQPSAVGEGWTLTGGGFIERRYVPCAQEQAPGSPVAGKADLCWATDNATISFGGRSGALVKDSSSGVWKLQGDDNSRVERLTGQAQGCATNGTYNQECWRLTTTNGTQYYFGLNRLPGWSSGKSVTNSAWTVPVFGNDNGDPCKASTFAASSCQQGWRWNLDYVVDVNGNAQAFYYAAETNKYRANDSTVTSYVRGGQLIRVEYGLKSSTVYAANAATGRVLFGYDAKGRCNPANASACSSVTLGGDATTPTTPSAYPDVPFDLNCTTGTCSGQTSPSFWTTARLTTITPQVYTPSGYQAADRYALTHSFPDPGDGQAAALWLDSVQRTGARGTDREIVENPTTFLKTSLQNRVWVVDGLAPLDKFRVSSIALPSGARISVNYSAQECTEAMAPTILAAPWNNTRRCFPMWWTPDLSIAAPARQDLFHKYVVTSMIEDPYTGGGGSPAQRTQYLYTGTPGWRYVDDPLVPSDRRSWSEYAGYDKVEVRVGDPDYPATQQTTQYTFYRGLNGDRANASGGTKSVTVTGTSVPDDRWFGGLTRSEKVLRGVGGATVSETTTTPWASAVTADDGLRQARILGVSRQNITTPLSTGGTRTTSTISTMDARGFVTQVSSEAGSGQRATCTTTSYAADNTSSWVIGLPSVVTDYDLPCSQLGSAVVPTNVTSHKTFAYDGGAVGAAASKGLPSETKEASGFAGNTLASATMIRSNTYAYDAMGRPTSSTDAGNRTVSTTYSPSAAAAAGSGPLLTTTVTNPLGWTTSTTVDAFRGLPQTVTDENGNVISTAYDGLGRLTALWRTDRPKGSHPEPSVAYEYGVFSDKPSYVKTTTIVGDGFSTSYALYDGLGRPVQTQGPVVGGGAVITDTEYDAAGREVATNDAYYAPAVTPGTALFVPSAVNQIASRTETTYDGAGFATAEVLRSFGAEIRRTTQVYRGSDRIDETPPSGGIPRSTFTDAWGQTTRVTDWMGAIDGTGVASTSLSYQYNGRGERTRLTDGEGNQWTWTYSLQGLPTATTDPDSGTTSYTYDALGNVTTSTDGRGITRGFTYDKLNRKTTERAGGTSGSILASWTYDTLAKGLVSSSSRFDGGLEYKTAIKGYDTGYRPTGSTLTIPQGAPAFGGTSYATNNYYNEDGTLYATTRPAVGGLPAETLISTYDILGRQAGLLAQFGTSYASAVSYQPTGEVGQIVRPGTVWSALTLGYDPATRQLSSLDETTRRNNTVFTQEAHREYTRNAAGLITKAVTTSDSQSADTQCFQYDANQNLSNGWTPASGDCTTGPTATRGGPAPYRVAYSVDRDTGNRLSVKTWTGSTTTTATYTYPAAGGTRPHAVAQTTTVSGTQTTVTSYAHDAGGSMTTRGAQTLAYDEAGRLSSVATGSTTEKSLYGADGALLMRWGAADGASLFIGDTTLRDKSGVKTGIRTYAVAGITVAERVSGSTGGLWWSSPDPVGTVNLEINASTGTVTRRWTDPFGLTRGSGTAWSSNLGYLNQPRSSTGLTQLGARAYDAELGQFITVDPLMDTSNPRHTNPFAYAFNSPISYSDADGLEPRPGHKGIIVGSSNNTQPGSKSPAAAPAAGNTGGGNPPAASQTEQQWWNPWSWNEETWRGVGTVAVVVGSVVATVAIGACVVATAGICAAVGVGIGAVAGAVVGASTSAALYQLEPGPKTAEGAFGAQLTGAALGLVGGGTGIAVKSVTTAAANLERVAVVETTAKLTAKADDVHAVLDPIASKQRTTAALSTKEGTTIVGGGARDLNPAQVTVATQDGAQVARSSGAHAEVTVVEYARDKGLTPQVIVATRNFCDRCTSFLESEGATIVGPRTARWDK